MSAKKASTKSAKKTARVASKKSGKKIAKKQAANGAKKLAKKVAKKAAKKSTRKRTKKVAKAAAGKGPTKPARKANGKASANSRKVPPAPRVSSADRHAMIAKAAYYRAERRNFEQGDPVLDWLAGEKEVDAVLHPRG